MCGCADTLSALGNAFAHAVQEKKSSKRRKRDASYSGSSDDEGAANAAAAAAPAPPPARGRPQGRYAKREAGKLVKGVLACMHAAVVCSSTLTDTD